MLWKRTTLYLSRLPKRIVCFFRRHRPIKFVSSGDTYCIRCGGKI